MCGGWLASIQEKVREASCTSVEQDQRRGFRNSTRFPQKRLRTILHVRLKMPAVHRRQVVFANRWQFEVRGTQLRKRRSNSNSLDTKTRALLVPVRSLYIPLE